ncbi:LysR substrate-binding domain-containing protein [Solidesulfovibrio sp. C21]|uniref:LysR substrate-binding domain-containing protein n=1 Tax=Solidesulfovibrio sp. C21 TaxID=3398613 RepID=UPI0039FC28F6
MAGIGTDAAAGTGLYFEPVFDYEQVLVVGPNHPLRAASHIEPEQLAVEILITYPVHIDRLDIYSRFLTPAGIIPKQHKRIETTEIMLQMVASGRGVAALPRWLVEENAGKFAVFPVRLGAQGIDKKIFLGIREADVDIDYLRAFVDLARAYRDR